jgi:hypothetical protein
MSPKDLTEYSGCVLAVVDSTFKVVSVDLERIGTLSVLLPWSLDYPTHEVSWESFGMSGLN